MQTKYLKKLNPNQRQAVLHEEGPLLVLAGAGSGKTSTMTYRMIHLITQKKVSPRQILGLSFTNKAAGELRDRVYSEVRKITQKRTQGLTVSTFHSLCVKILRQEASRLGYTSQFSILDQNDQIEIIRKILRKNSVDDKKFDPSFILFGIGQAKNRFIPPHQSEAFFMNSARNEASSPIALEMATTYPEYQDQLRAMNAMDFDDLLFNAVDLLKKHPEVCDAYNDRFKYILVDEYQDTNQAQFELIRLLTLKQQNICVVGDDDQSIYAWRGADPSHILNFGKHYPGAKTVTLDQNYRSTQTILDAANQVIQNNSVRHPKSLWSQKEDGPPITLILTEDDHDEATTVAERIFDLAKKHEGGEVKTLMNWSDFAILFRSNPQSRHFEEALRMKGIPYRLVGSFSFLDRKEIKDTLSYWKTILNPDEETALRRIINWPARGIGKKTIDTIHSHSVENQCSFFESIPDADLKTKPKQAVMTFASLIQKMRNALEKIEPEPTAMADWARQTFEWIGMRTGIENDVDDALQASQRWEMVQELAHGLGQMKLEEPAENSFMFLREYITRLTLDAEEESEEEESKEKDEVTLMTLHGSKGLEFPTVFLVGMEDGYLPHQRVMDEATDYSEERRLCYVGITRAKEKLYLTRAKNRIRYGKPVPRYPSRFLSEIPGNLIFTEDVSSTPDLSSQVLREAHEQKVSSFLEQMKSKLS
ncbi:MAG: ATP-dependent DNA helicase Rep [Bdellovibrionaceae bacterium]|nr:ATP-dependent DNA helicase Rep [Pseudobdellovibrionaceae bacterium]